MSGAWTRSPTWLLVAFVFATVAFPSVRACSGEWSAPCATSFDCPDYKVTWTYLEVLDMMQFTVTSTQSRNKWIGVGFSENRNMAQSDVVIGYVTSRGGTIIDGWMDGVIPTKDYESSLVQPAITYADGAYALAFMRRIGSNDPQGQDVSLDRDFYFLFPVVGGTYSLWSGAIRQSVRSVFSEMTFNFASCTVADTGSPTPAPTPVQTTTTTTTTTSPPTTTTTAAPTTTTATTTTTSASTTTTSAPTTTTSAPTTTTSAPTTTTSAPTTTTSDPTTTTSDPTTTTTTSTTTTSPTTTTTTASAAMTTTTATMAPREQTTPGTATVNLGCTNSYGDEDCMWWADNGECTGNADFMRTSCTKACGLCSGDENTVTTRAPMAAEEQTTTIADIISGDCMNSHGDADCIWWAEDGECAGNPDFMHIRCTKACGLCSGDDDAMTTRAPTATEEHTTTLTDVISGDCMNSHGDADCIWWAEDGECAGNPDFMHIRCAKACGLCSGDDDAMTTRAPTATEEHTTTLTDVISATCVNHHGDEHCVAWAGDGECINNPDFMRASCMKACGLCPGGCVNSNGNDEQCAQWASAGECTANPDWMNINCERACGQCVSTCVNTYGDDDQCMWWAHDGECDNNSAFMDVNCEKACGLCHGSCVNRYDNGTDDGEEECVGWAYDGECTANPDFMRMNCQKSCGMCPGSNIPPEHYYGGSTTSEFGTFIKIVCQFETLSLSCPVGYVINIHDGVFGRSPDVDTCMAAGNNVAVDADCTDADVVNDVARLCDFEQECSFDVDTAVFGDPCPGHVSYLNITYTCQLPVFRQWSCEDTDLHLYCEEPDRVIVMEYASFGRSNSFSCPDDTQNMDERCYSDSIWQDMATMCDGRNDCHLYPSVQTFGDPCNNTRKFMEVSYTCGVCENLFESDDADAECKVWADNGECDSNKGWMYAYCRKACTKCHLLDTCFDLHPSQSDCEYWAFRGGCVVNRPWMTTNCARTCSFCDDVHWPAPATAAPTTWAPATLSEDSIKVIACNYTNAILTCPEGQHIRVEDAFFGRRDPHICASGVAETTCDNYVPETFTIVSELCNGRSSCVLWAGGDPPFKEPCHYTFKYLEIDYTCEACENVYGDDSQCTSWADFPGPQMGCAYNRYWMNHNCFKACSGCETAETCQNFIEDRLCDYYASWHQCEVHPAFMHYSCPKSCRTCWLYN